MSSILRRAFAVLLSLVAALLVGEVLVRLLTDTSPLVGIRDGVLGAKHLPSYEGPHYSEEARRVVPVRFDHNGFRNPERPEVADAQVRRIAILGDSFVAGLEVEEQDTFCRVLEAKLNERHPEVRWEVMNFGVGTYDIAHGYVVYREVATRYRPDWVLFGFYAGNDLAISNRVRQNPQLYFDFDDSGELVQVQGGQQRSAAGLWLNRHSRFYIWQKRALRKRPLIRAYESDPLILEDYIHSTDPPPEVEHGWALTRALLERTRDLVRADEAPFGVFLIPSAEMVFPGLFEAVVKLATNPESFDVEHAERVLRGMCGELGIDYITPTTDFRTAANSEFPSDPTEYLFFHGIGHFTERGHALMAERLLRYLEKPGSNGTTPIERMVE